MRPIKYRAWDKEANTMRYSMLLGIHDCNTSLPPHIELMQFTGLYDKNGKEIYEGDIIEAEEPRFESGVYKYEVTFEDGTFGGNNHQGEFYPLQEWTEKQATVEVIGNIYENPDLLIRA